MKKNRIRTQSLEDSLRIVRERYPQATLEGSTGLNYSFWIDAKTVVATTWEMRGPSHHWWLVFETQII